MDRDGERRHRRTAGGRLGRAGRLPRRGATNVPFETGFDNFWTGSSAGTAPRTSRPSPR
jgi:hypothetical protein